MGLDVLIVERLLPTHRKKQSWSVNMQALYEGTDPFASFGENLVTIHQNLACDETVQQRKGLSDTWMGRSIRPCASSK